LTHRNLSVELRPKRLSEIIGQDSLVNDIRNKFSKGSVPLVIFLNGEYGSGKTTIARILASSFNCTHSHVFGEPCDVCLENADMFHIIERDCAVLSTKDEMELFLPTLHFYPNYGPYRIIILDEMQQTSAPAQTLLLKALEDVNSFNIFIIGTTHPDKINKGIIGRSVPFAMPLLDNSGIEALVLNTIKLAGERFGIEPRDPAPLVKALQNALITGGRNVVMATDLYLSGMAPEKAITVKEAGEVDYASLNRAVSQGDWESCRKVLDKAKPVDGDQIKMRVSAHFRSHLLRSTAGPRAELLSQFIRELAANNVVEAGLQLSAVVGTIYRICHIINEIKARGQAPSVYQSEAMQTLQ
jgi:replication-associated recombination protein RarA